MLDEGTKLFARVALALEEKVGLGDAQADDLLVLVGGAAAQRVERRSRRPVLLRPEQALGAAVWNKSVAQPCREIVNVNIRRAA